MKIKAVISAVLAFVLLMGAVMPAFAAAPQTASAAITAGESEKKSLGEKIVSFFKACFAGIKSFFEGIRYYFEVKKEKVPNTMNQNAVHMLKSVQDTIGDSFIITTEDGKVIVIDGGFSFETDYFVQYLKAVTGQRRPKIDAWFLSHPHTDHAEVFYEVAEHRAKKVKFDQVLLKYAPYDYYVSIDSEEGAEMVGEFDRISKAFPEKVRVLNDGDVFSIGAAKITVLYTFDPAFPAVNDASLVFRMDLGGKSVLFTGDAQVSAGKKVLAEWGGSGLLHCDICKMAHHGQDGVSREFYEAVAPEICLWPTPTWVWDNVNGNLKTPEVRAWMEDLGVKKNYMSWQGSQVIYLNAQT